MSNSDDKNRELELYKLVTQLSEFGWHGKEEFVVFPYMCEFADFMEGLSDIFGDTIYDDGGIVAYLKDGYICFDLLLIADNEGIELEKIFPFDEYKH